MEKFQLIKAHGVTSAAIKTMAARFWRQKLWNVHTRSPDLICISDQYQLTQRKMHKSFQ